VDLPEDPLSALPYGLYQTEVVRANLPTDKVECEGPFPVSAL